MDNLNIIYTYHTHKDGEGNVINAEYLASSGGCYTNEKEIKETVSVYITKTEYAAHVQSYMCYGTCSRCGYVSVSPTVFQQDPIYTNGKHTHSLGYYYYLGCGKTADTIESATIIY